MIKEQNLNTETPGGYIKKELLERGISQKEFADAISVSQSYLNDILSNRRKVSLQFALKAESLLGISSNIILGLQTASKIIQTKGNGDDSESQSLDLLQKLDEFVSVKTLCKTIKKKIVKPSEKWELLKKYFNIPDNFQDLRYNFNGCYRKSKITGVDERMISTWVIIAIALSGQNKPSGVFSPSKMDELIPQIVSILHKNTNTLSALQSLLDIYGIGLLRVNKVDRASIDGYSFYHNGIPYIALTCRYDRIDNLAFTILHELAHIKLQHTTPEQSRINLDLRSFDEDFEDTIEDKANNQASEWLIPGSKWKFAPSLSWSPFAIQEKYTKWAKAQNYNPWIVLGRLSYETGIYKFKSDETRKINGGKEVCHEIKI